MIIILIVAVLLILLYLLAIKGRIGKHDFKIFKDFHYAHRGLYSETVPENSMEAFNLALAHGYGIEFDLHLLKDGNLAVIHDSSLARTTGVNVNIEDLTTDELKNLTLNGTSETIPTFKQVLDLFDGKAPLIIELKSAKRNHRELVDEVCRQLKDYKGSYCLESFDPFCVYHLKKHYPEIIRGQLSENYFRANSKIPSFFKFLMTYNLINFLTKPDFIAYKFSDRKSNIGNKICQKLWKMQVVGWTVKDPEEHAQAIKENWISIFEGFMP